MNLDPTSKPTSTKVFDDQVDDVEESSLVSDRAQLIAERVSQKSGMKQVFVSLNVPVEAVQLMGHDMKLGLMLEKKICDTIKLAKE
jgi:hypothetical protein